MKAVIIPANQDDTVQLHSGVVFRDRPFMPKPTEEEQQAKYERLRNMQNASAQNIFGNVGQMGAQQPISRAHDFLAAVGCRPFGI